MLSLPAPSVNSDRFSDELLSALSYTYPSLEPAHHDPDGPTSADEAWECGYTLGFDGEPARASSDYSPALAYIWQRGYEAGEVQRWREYDAWLAAFDRYRGAMDPDLSGCEAHEHVGNWRPGDFLG